jgi:hypothetical protein
MITREGKSSLTPECITKLEELGYKFNTRSNDNFDEMYEELEKFKWEHGHWKTGNPKNPLSRFVIKVRATYQRMIKQGKPSLRFLTPERMEKLNKIGFAFEKSPKEQSDDQWELRFEELVKFYEKNGHLLVTLKGNSSMYAWLKGQRKAYRNAMEKMRSDFMAKRTAAAVAGGSGKASVETFDETTKGKNILSSDQIMRLQMLGLEWNVQETRDLKIVEKWEKNYTKLLKFKLDTGHTRVARNQQENPTLGQWVRKQRQSYAQQRGSAHTLTDERIARLDGIGFEWRLK